MVYTQHQGIVLRTYIPQKQKLSILDCQLGRIDCIPQGKKNQERLFHGAYITYAVKPWGDFYIAYDIDLLDIPSYSTEQNFLFFHHLLELCFCFLPINNTENDIFDLMRYAYTQSDNLKTPLAQKIFLCHFFKCLSIYPSDIQMYGSSFFRLLSAPLDSKFNAEDEEKLIIYLNKWLLACVSTHPYVNSIKTIEYLKK